MPDHDVFVGDELRTSVPPPVDTQALVSAATTAGRRRVRRRRGGVAVAALAVLGTVGGGLALAGPSAERADSSLVAENPDPTPDATPTQVAETTARTPKGGTQHADVIRPFVQQAVVPITPGDDHATGPDAETPGLPAELVELLSREPRTSGTVIGAEMTTVEFLWGTEGFTPEEAEAHNRLTPKGRHFVEVTSAPLPEDRMAHCRSQHGSAPRYIPGTCRTTPDGVVYAEMDHYMEDSNIQVRGIVVYHDDNWVQRIEVRPRGFRGTPPDLSDVVTTATLKEIALEGDWWE